MTSELVETSKNYKSKGFVLNYNPDGNRKNIYARKLQQPLPEQKQQFSENPFTKIMQP